MTHLQVLRGRFDITDPNWPKYSARRVLTSDDFSGVGELVGSMTNVAFGGTPMEWEGTPGGWLRSDEAIVTPQENYLDELSLSNVVSDHAVSVKVVDLGPDRTASPQIVLSTRSDKERRNRLRLVFRASGLMQLEMYIDGVRETGPSLTDAFGDGDRVGILASGEKFYATVNGKNVLEWETPLTGPGDTLMTTYRVVDMRIDDFVLTEA